MNQILIAFLMTVIAGLATGVGSCIAFFAKKTNTKFLSLSLGFSAGVMIYVSMIEIFDQAKQSLVSALGVKMGNWATVLAFFGGIALIAIIDRLIPSAENPHEVKSMENGAIDSKKAALLRTGVFTALAIGIHNFPEGLATFVAGLNDMSIALPITVAIAIHNIPEGISVSVPIYYATGDKKKAFRYSFLSGMSEPIGAIVGYLLLRNFLNDALFGIVFAGVAGIMVFISLDELLPSAREYGHHHLAIYGLISGMAVMALSLLMFI
ncbi:MAG: zinc transporter ZupT [Cellulosilyticaceae bacterium]